MLKPHKRAVFSFGGVAELAYAADLKSASSDCGFESHRPYHFSALGKYATLKRRERYMRAAS